MPRATGTTECTARWNSLDDAEFQSLIERGYINVDDITPKFIESIKTRQGWEKCSATNFRQNYRRVANTLQLTLHLNGARVRQKGESCRVFSFFGIFSNQIRAHSHFACRHKRRQQRRRRQRCWETESARPSPLVPVKSNLSVVPTSLPECFLVDIEVSSCSKIRFLLYL